MTEPIAFSHTQGLDLQASHTHTPTLRTEGGGAAVMEPRAPSENQRGELLLTDQAHQLTTGGGKPGQGYPAVFEPMPALEENWAETDTKATLRAEASKSSHAVVSVAKVRRLTPVECERLMGFDDDHTRWRADGTEVSDSARYRMCGNGVASPVAQWIAEQLNRGTV